MKKLSLYIHIPFCPYHCHYCDFLSFTHQEALIPSYVKSLTQDLKSFSEKLKDYEIHSVFFGGGTPSLLSGSQIREILLSVENGYALKSDAEITLESNPGTIGIEKLVEYRQAGINRLSLGVQAFQNHHLKRMGRIHTVSEAEEAFIAARKSGFQNISFDLIFGLPDQTMTEWMDTLHGAVSWGPEHLSVYGLQVEEGTPFSRDLKTGALLLPEEENQAQMYETTMSFLEDHEFAQYEISNFTKPGAMSIHNLTYWNNEEYLGIGVGATSYLNRERFWMTRNLTKYVTGEERVIGGESLDIQGQIGETMMLGLRLRSGVSGRKFQERFRKNLQEVYGEIISKLEASEFLEWKNDSLMITRKGLLIANAIIQEFLADRSVTL